MSQKVQNIWLFGSGSSDKDSDYKTDLMIAVESVRQVRVKLSELLTQLQTQESKDNAAKIKNDTDQFVNFLKGVQELQDKIDKEHSVIKWIGIALVAIAATVALLTGQVVIAALIIALAVAQTTGAVDKALDKMGAPPWVKLAVKVVIAVVVGILTCGAGSLIAVGMVCDALASLNLGGTIADMCTSDEDTKAKIALAINLSLMAVGLVAGLRGCFGAGAGEEGAAVEGAAEGAATLGSSASRVAAAIKAAAKEAAELSRKANSSLGRAFGASPEALSAFRKALQAQEKAMELELGVFNKTFKVTVGQVLKARKILSGVGAGLGVGAGGSSIAAGNQNIDQAEKVKEKTKMQSELAIYRDVADRLNGSVSETIKNEGKQNQRWAEVTDAWSHLSDDILAGAQVLLHA